jgi:hypothetical protein
MVKEEEKRENLSLRKLRKPGERKREKYFALFFEFPIQKGKKLFSEKTEKTWRKRKRKGSATFLLHLADDGILSWLYLNGGGRTWLS